MKLNKKQTIFVRRVIIIIIIINTGLTVFSIWLPKPAFSQTGPINTWSISIM